MKLPIVKQKKSRHITSCHVMWVSIVIFFMLLGSVSFGLLRPSLFIYVLILITGLMPVATNLYGNFEYFPSNFEVVSELNLLTDAVGVGYKQVQLESLHALDIEVNDWHGKKVVFNVRAYGSGPKLSRGVNNYLKMYYKDNSEERIQFQIESEGKFIELSECVKAWYSSAIKISEQYDHSRSYGLKHLSYSEVQEFKDRFGNS